jgi:hypothetical protein
LFLFSQKAIVPLLAITGQYPFYEIFPKYLNLLFMTILRIILNLKLVLISTASLKLNPPAPTW